MNTRMFILSALIAYSQQDQALEPSSPQKRGSYQTISPDSLQIITASDEQEMRVPYLYLTWEETINRVHTPRQAQDYLDQHMRQEDPTLEIESFAENHRDRRGDCLDYALAAAALLIDDKYIPAVLRMFDEEVTQAHAVFLHRTETGYGALGNSPLPPIYQTVPALVAALNHKYHMNFTKFHVVDVTNSFPQQQWVFGDSFLELYTAHSTLSPVL